MPFQGKACARGLPSGFAVGRASSVAGVLAAVEGLVMASILAWFSARRCRSCAICVCAGSRFTWVDAGFGCGAMTRAHSESGSMRTSMPRMLSNVLCLMTTSPIDEESLSKLADNMPNRLYA